MANTAAGKGHFNELDIVKGIGIWAVVIGHLQPKDPTITVIYSVHMFLFFFCSGFLGERFKERSYGSVLWGNVKRLLFPYAVWGILSQVFVIAQGEQTIGKALKEFFFLGKWVGWNAPLWFLVVLFWTEMIGYWVAKAHILLKFLMMAVAAAGWYVISRGGYGIWFGFRLVPIGLFFWIFGLVVREYYSKGEEWFFGKRSFLTVVKQLLLLAPLFGVWIFFGVVRNETISVYHMTYSNYPYTLLAGMAGVLFLLLLSKVMSETWKWDPGYWIGKLFALFGKNSLLILCTHHFFLRMVQDYSKANLGKNMWLFKDTGKAFRIGSELMLLYLVLILLLMPIKKKGFLKYLI
jgi:fucose 4-O-acetylase-like acetyltransferase